MKNALDLVAAARARIREIPLEQATHAVQQADYVLDVREADEYAAGHLPGAISMPRGVLEFRLGSSPELEARDRSFVLYCKTSGRAALAALAMHEMGYVDVGSIAGGFDAWAAAGLPVAKPQQPRFG